MDFDGESIKWKIVDAGTTAIVKVACRISPDDDRNCHEDDRLTSNPIDDMVMLYLREFFNYKRQIVLSSINHRANQLVTNYNDILQSLKKTYERDQQYDSWAYEQDKRPIIAIIDRIVRSNKKKKKLPAEAILDTGDLHHDYQYYYEPRSQSILTC
jgi:hypothetical protein